MEEIEITADSQEGDGHVLKSKLKRENMKCDIVQEDSEKKSIPSKPELAGKSNKVFYNAKIYYNKKLFVIIFY